MKVTHSILLASLMLSFYACKNENSKIDSLVPSQSLAAYECYFFFIADCPASRNNIPKISELSKKYKPLGLRVIGVVSDPFINMDYLHETLKELDFQIDIEIDSTLSIARKHDASVTPEAFLYKSGVLVYSGLLDNYYFELGKHRKIVTTNYLELAIQSSLQNSPFEKRTEAIGCKINFDARDIITSIH